MGVVLLTLTDRWHTQNVQRQGSNNYTLINYADKFISSPKFSHQLNPHRKGGRDSTARRAHWERPWNNSTWNHQTRWTDPKAEKFIYLLSMDHVIQALIRRTYPITYYIILDIAESCSASVVKKWVFCHHSLRASFSKSITSLVCTIFEYTSVFTH